MTDRRFNIYIVKDDWYKAVAKVWNNVWDRMAERIVAWAMINLNHNEYTVQDVMVGSEEDSQFENDLLANTQS